MHPTATFRRRAFKAAAAATLPALIALLQPGHAAHAAGQATPAAAAPSLKLFADSTLVGGDRISVEVVGHGPDVILIPGLASSRETYRRTAERLRGRYRLHLVQVAGFAGEPARANAAGPVYLPTVEAIDAYIVKAGLRKPAVVGHSLGGLMTLELALDHPDHVGKAMIVDTLAFYSELFAGPGATAEGAKPIAEQVGARMLTVSDADYAKNAAAVGAQLTTAPADRDRVAAWSIASDRAVMVKAEQEDMTTDLRPRIATLSTPVTVIYEKPLEALVQADYAPARDKTLVPAAPGAKHFIMYDDPAGFDAALDAFLAK